MHILQGDARKVMKARRGDVTPAQSNLLRQRCFYVSEMQTCKADDVTTICDRWYKKNTSPVFPLSLSYFY